MCAHLESPAATGAVLAVFGAVVFLGAGILIAILLLFQKKNNEDDEESDDSDVDGIIWMPDGPGDWLPPYLREDGDELVDLYRHNVEQFAIVLAAHHTALIQTADTVFLANVRA
jgi:hypothetical protein